MVDNIYLYLLASFGRFILIFNKIVLISLEAVISLPFQV